MNKGQTTATVLLAAGVTATFVLFMAPAITPIEKAKAATIYFSDNLESGAMNAWDWICGDICATATQAKAHDGNWSMDLSITPNDNPGEPFVGSKKVWKKDFGPGPGRGPKGGMLEGYFSAWYWFGDTPGSYGANWHNVFQFFTKGCGTVWPFGCLIHHLDVRTWPNGVFQAMWVMDNCEHKRHPLTQSCPQFDATRYTQTGNNGGWVLQKNPIPIPRNRWVHFEVYYKAARIGGITKVWQDGVLLFDLSDATKTSGAAYNNLDAYGYNNNTTTSVACADSSVANCYADTMWGVLNYMDNDPEEVLHELYLDDARVTDTRVGPGPMPAPPPPPAAPMNLRIVQ